MPSDWCGLVGVVLLPPGIHRGLGGLDRGKRPGVVEEVGLQGLVPALDLADGGRRVDLGQPVGDAVLPADPVEHHLDRDAWLAEPAGEHLAVGQHFLRYPVDAHRAHERLAHRPGSCPQHRFGDDAEPGMVIQPGHDLGLCAIGQKGASGHVQLPQLHRHRPFPPPVILAAPPPGRRLDQPVADQGAVHRRPGHGAIATAVHLEHQPTRTPPGMHAAQLADCFLDLSGDPPRMAMDAVRAVLQPGDAFSPVTPQPVVHALAADPIPFGDFCYRYTRADLQHGPVSLLGHAQLPQHERECQASNGAKMGQISPAVDTQFAPPRRCCLLRPGSHPKPSSRHSALPQQLAQGPASPAASCASGAARRPVPPPKTWTARQTTARLPPSSA